jgi:hypothetical protein
MSKKDIFIDNNIAKNFTNPLDPEYKKLIKWLITFDEKKKGHNAYLVVSNKLLAEYHRTSGLSYSLTNITVIIGKLQKEGRLIKISNQAIKEFKRQYFSKKVKKKLTCNQEDWEHIPVILLSDRKYALSFDVKFLVDLENFPGFLVKVARRPQDLPYDK